MELNDALPRLPLRVRVRLVCGLPCFTTALAACGGILLADAQAGVAAWVWLAAALGALVLLAVRVRLALVWVAAAAGFAFAHHARDRDPLRELLAARLAPGAALPVEVTGLIDDAPEQDEWGWSVRFPLRVEALRHRDLPEQPPGAVLYMTARDFPQTLRYGDRIRLTGLLRRSEAPRNPGEFDFPAFARRLGYSAEFEAGGEYDRLEVLERDAGLPVLAAAQRSREWIGAAVTHELEAEPDMAAAIRAMVLGTREHTPQEVEDAFKASGAMHVFAVSGLHVAMFGAILWMVLPLLGLSRAAVTWVIIPAVFYYVFVTGLRPSAWRAAVMGSVVLLGALADRRSSLLNSLGAAALLLLGWNTQQLFQPGFTLSFGVLLAIALLATPLRRRLHRWYSADPFLPEPLYSSGLRAKLTAWRWTADSLAVSLASTVGSAPLMLHYFRMVTPAGIVANLFLVFLSLCILVLACAALAAAAVKFTLVQSALNQANVLLTSLSVWLAKIFAAMPGGHIRCDTARLFRGDLCELTVLQLDSGGSAAHLDTPQSRHWLIDTGGLRHFRRNVQPHLARTPVNRLDALLLTHADAYHTGAAALVRADFPPQQEPELFAGMEVFPDAHTRVRCLFPPRGYEAGVADDRCRVLLIECRGTRVLLMGDSGFITETALLESGEELRADVLVKGWHADDYSGLPSFLNAVSPRAVVCTNSAFPEHETIPPWWRELAAEKGIALLDQARTGGVTIRIARDGTTLHGYYDGSTLTLPPAP